MKAEDTETYRTETWKIEELQKSQKLHRVEAQTEMASCSKSKAANLFPQASGKQLHAAKVWSTRSRQVRSSYVSQ